MAPSVRLKGDYDSNRNKENTSLKKEKYLQRIQRYPEFSEKPIALITKKDCDTIIRFIEDSDARVYEHAVLKPEAKEFKTMSCPKIAKNVPSVRKPSSAFSVVKPYRWILRNRWHRL